VVGDQTERELVTAAHYAENDVLATDPVVLVRQGFPPGQCKHFLGRFGKGCLPAAGPAARGRRTVVRARAESTVDSVADCTQIDADRPQCLDVVLEWLAG
jgi:hypothetical protein